MRALPWSDPSVDALPPATRALLARLWAGRAASERRVGHAFAALAEELSRMKAAPALIALARQGARDEPRHADLCLRLAARYAGEPAREPARGPVHLPYLRLPPRTRLTLRCAALACVSETIACAWLGGCADLASTPLARAANRAHLGDEIRHARLGWALLASPIVGRAERAALSRRLSALVVDGVRAWLAAAAVLPARGVLAQGVPSRALHRRWVAEATHQLVLPGFSELGFPTIPAARACARLWRRSDVAGHGNPVPDECP
jgi:hypothetical protein